MSAQALIHPTAVVSPGAKIGAGVKIGPYCVLGEHVELGDRCELHSHVVLDGRTKLGSENALFPFCSVGTNPQDLKYKGEESVLEIGDKNVIREYVTIQPGTEGGGMRTVVGSGNLFMASSHVGHDCVVGDGNVLANGAALAGHVTLENYAILGGLVGVHQFCRIGDYVFLGAGSMAAKDIPPFAMAQGDRAKISGINTIGLKRRGFNSEEIREIRRAFHILFSGSSIGTPLKERIEAIQAEAAVSEGVQQLCNFVEHSERGVASGQFGDGGE